MEALEKFPTNAPKSIQVVTDDSQISEEISRISKLGFEFLKPDPAPKRIPDKVCSKTLIANKLTIIPSKGKEEFSNIGH